MHVDDLPEDIPRERFRWMEVKIRVLVDTQDELLTGKEYAKKGVRAYFDAAYEIDMLSLRSDGVGVCVGGGTSSPIRRSNRRIAGTARPRRKIGLNDGLSDEAAEGLGFQTAG